MNSKMQRRTLPPSRNVNIPLPSSTPTSSHRNLRQRKRTKSDYKCFGRIICPVIVAFILLLLTMHLFLYVNYNLTSSSATELHAQRRLTKSRHTQNRIDISSIQPNKHRFDSRRRSDDSSHSSADAASRPHFTNKRSGKTYGARFNEEFSGALSEMDNKPNKRLSHIDPSAKVAKNGNDTAHKGKTKANPFSYRHLPANISDYEAFLIASQKREEKRKRKAALKEKKRKKREEVEARRKEQEGHAALAHSNKTDTKKIDAAKRGHARGERRKSMDQMMANQMSERSPHSRMGIGMNGSPFKQDRVFHEVNASQSMLTLSELNAFSDYFYLMTPPRNAHWTPDAINQLQTKRNKLYSKYHITPFSTDVPYDLILLEMEIVTWIISNQYVKQCPPAFHGCRLQACGFGCQLDDYLVICANLALSEGVPFEIEYGYLEEYGAWDTVFEPVTNLREVCTVSEYRYAAVSKARKSKLIYWVPKRYHSRIADLHFDPALWFHGILNRFFMRLNTDSLTAYQKLRDTYLAKKLEYFYGTNAALFAQYSKLYSEERYPIIDDSFVGFERTLQSIGIHVRRTDKITESDLWGWDAYLPVLQKFTHLLQSKYTTFNQIDDDNAVAMPHLLIATDDAVIVESILTESSQYPLFVNPKSIQIQMNGNDTMYISEYKSDESYNTDIHLSDRNVERVNVSLRASDNAMLNVVLDAFLLSETDCFIGQDSSRVSRLIVQLMATRKYNFNQMAASVDHHENTKGEILFPWWIPGFTKKKGKKKQAKAVVAEESAKGDDDDDDDDDDD